MTFEECVAQSARTLQALTEIRPAIDRAAGMILETLRRGGKVLVAGNGGSAAEASHLATELVGRYGKNRPALPAIALTPDGALLSCIGNDFGFEEVFARQVAGLGKPGDLLVVFTSSGNSANLLRALDAAKQSGLATLSFLGRGGGKCRGKADCELIVPGGRGACAQEAHLFLIHYFCELLDEAF
ncbi:MAG: D-sedoheptulose-7-phosphate isomerase [Opitutaceae bacterium]